MKAINGIKVFVLSLAFLQSNAAMAQPCKYQIRYVYQCETDQKDKCPLKLIEVFNEAQLKIAKIELDSSAKIVGMSVIEHDSNQRRIGVLNFNELGHVISSISPIYDSVGKKYSLAPIDISESDMCPINGHSKSDTHYCKRDDCGNIVEEIIYSPVNRSRVLFRQKFSYRYFGTH
jgi:hypothetical protein